MLVTAEEMLKKAKAGKYAVGQFNINNLEWTKAILATAQELQSPVILGVSEGAGKYMTGFGTVAAMVKAMIEEMNITVPVLCIWIMEPMKDAISASRLVSPPSCLMVLICRSKRISRRPRNLLLYARAWECLLRQKLVLSAARKMAL